MKVTLFTIAAAGLAAAQMLDGVPPCVQKCVEKALGDSGCKGSAQEIAICACKPDIQAKLLSPVSKCATENKCDPADLLKAQEFSSSSCKALASSSHDGGAKSTAAPTSSVAPTGTATPPSPSATGVTVGNNSTTIAGTGTGVISGAGKPTGTGSGVKPTTTNAAPAMAPAAGALFALLAAAVAAL